MEFLQKKYGGLPVWAWGLIVIGGVVVGLYFLKNKGIGSVLTGNAGTTSSGTSSTSEAAGTVDSQTVPVTSASPVYVLSTSNPGTTTSTDGQTSTTTTNTGDGNTSGTTTSNIKIRPSQALTGGIFQQYDQGHSGIPLRNSPGGSQYTPIPFGASVTLTGNAQSGPQTGGNSTIYYPVTYNGQSGYVSALDLTGLGGGENRTYAAGILGAY